MARSSAIFAALIAATLTAVASAVPAHAENSGRETEALYRSTFVVTGSDERNRKFGITQCFAQMLVKLTGDPAIVEDARFPGVAAQAVSFVQSFHYRDRLFGRPIHDEQGSYDRPHNLTVAFVPQKIDAVVRALGRAPWVAPRPRVVVLLGVENFKATFMLTRDGTVDRSADMRSAFAAAAERIGLSVTFPTRAELEARGFTAKTLGDVSAADAAAVARAEGGDIALRGRMVFSDAAFGWIARWRLDTGGKAHDWGVRGVNFDAAFRNALFGAAKILSGNGAPK